MFISFSCCSITTDEEEGTKIRIYIMTWCKLGIKDDKILKVLIQEILDGSALILRNFRDDLNFKVF